MKSVVTLKSNQIKKDSVKQFCGTEPYATGPPVGIRMLPSWTRYKTVNTIILYQRHSNNCPVDNSIRNSNDMPLNFNTFIIIHQ